MPSKTSKTTSSNPTAPADFAKWNSSKTPIRVGRVDYPAKFWNGDVVRNTKKDGSGSWVRVTDTTAIEQWVAASAASYNESVPAPAHKISDDAAANRRAASAAKRAAAKRAAAKPAKSSAPAKSTSSSKPATKRTRTPKSDDPIALHIREALAPYSKRGTFVSIREIASMTTAAFPTDDVRPPLTTISGRVRREQLPEGWKPATGGERNVRGVISTK